MEDLDLELDLKRLIVKSLILDHLRAEDIDATAPLFGEGLGLDSIDVLELAMALERTYRFKLRADDPDNRKIFGSVRSLAAHVATHRKDLVPS